MFLIFLSYDNEKEDKKRETKGNKYDRMAGLKGSGDKSIDKIREEFQDQVVKDIEEQQDIRNKE